jgi:hypothetical protein
MIRSLKYGSFQGKTKIAVAEVRGSLLCCVTHIVEESMKLEKKKYPQQHLSCSKASGF